MKKIVSSSFHIVCRKLPLKYLLEKKLKKIVNF